MPKSKTPPTTLKELLQQSVEAFDKETALYRWQDNQATPVTYRELGRQVDALGTALLRLPLKRRRIAIIGRNSYEWGLAYLAVMNGAGIAIPLDKELSAHELAESLIRVEADVIMYSSDVAEKVNAARAVRPLGHYIAMDLHDSDHYMYDLVTDGQEAIEAGNHDFRRAKIDHDATAALLFTSGTTSRSKIVMLSHANITSNVVNAVPPFRLGPSDTFLSLLPMHHMFECVAGFLAPLSAGSSVYFSQGLRYISQEIKQQQPTIIVCVPRIIDALSANIDKKIRQRQLEAKVDRLIALTNMSRIGVRLKRVVFGQIHRELGGRMRFFVSGAASLNQSSASRLTGLGFTIFQGYGLTECSPALSMSHFKCNDIDSVGRPVAGTELIIHQPDEAGIGEILAKGPQVMLGYYDNPEAAAKAFAATGHFRTGDLGLMKANGCLKIVGRTKNIIVTSGGKKIYPEELESLLLESPSVKEVVVRGEEVRGATVIVAEVVLAEAEQEPDQPAIEAEARAYIEAMNQTLANYEKIQRIDIRANEFAKTSTLKIKR